MSPHDRWSSEEVDRFLAASAGSRIEAAWSLIALAGLRTGELVALRWANVNLGAASIHVEYAVPGVAYQAISPAPMAARARVIGIDAALSGILTQHRKRQQAERPGWIGVGFVICHDSRHPMHPRHLCRLFERSARRQGLRPIRLSALRSTRAPMLPEIAA